MLPRWRWRAIRRASAASLLRPPPPFISLSFRSPSQPPFRSFPTLSPRLISSSRVAARPFPKNSTIFSFQSIILFYQRSC